MNRPQSERPPHARALAGKLGELLREATTPLLEVHNLSVRFDTNGRSFRAVDHLSYRLHPGQTLAIIGESGSGKTVSCRALMGLLPQTATVSGSVKLNGAELVGLHEAQMRRHRGADVAMVFQDAARALNPTMRVGYQITEAVRHHEGLDRDSARQRAVELLRLLQVPAPDQRFMAWPHELSGGLRQRVLIAIAVACKPRLLIADEATRSLDAITQAETLALLKQLQQQLGMALIMVSHDLRLASSFSDEVLVMYAGRAVEHAPTKQLFRRARMPYTRALMDAAPGLDRPAHTSFPVIAGQPPDLSALPPGCAFEPRCSRTLPICGQKAPVFEEQDAGHSCACWNPAEGPGRA